MKKIIITTLVFFLILTNSVFAESQPMQTTYFDIDLEFGTQSVWNDSIPLTIYITPTMDASRVEITADTPTALDFQYLGKQYFPVKQEQTYTLRSRIIPKNNGIYTITVNAISWEHDTNYASSNSITLTLDEDLKVTPETPAYRRNTLLKYVFLITLGAGCAGVGIYFSKHGIKKFKKWFLPQD